MSDFAERDIERAQECIDFIHSKRIEAIRTSLPDPNNAVKTCEECGANMPPKRAALGYKLCIDCKTDEELRQKLIGA